MLKSLLLSAAVTASLATGAFAQSTSTAPASPMAPMTTTPATPTATSPTVGAIRGSSLINMNVKNRADEKIGDINDVIVGLPYGANPMSLYSPEFTRNPQ